MVPSPSQTETKNGTKVWHAEAGRDSAIEFFNQSRASIQEALLAPKKQNTPVENGVHFFINESLDKITC